MVSLTVCGHLIHTKCLKEWVLRQTKCPLCRQQFSDDNLIVWEKKFNIDFYQMKSIRQSDQYKEKQRICMKYIKNFKNKNK